MEQTSNGITKKVSKMLENFDGVSESLQTMKDTVIENTKEYF